MEKGSVSEQDIRETDEYLRGYALNRKMLRMDRYERTYLGWRPTEEDLPGEPPLARARMYEVRQFIMALPNSDEKLLLYYHYVRGESVEKCAELLGISRSSGFRMKKRALIRATMARNNR